MGDLKNIGSEKLQGQDKINRIMEIARYGESRKNETNHTSTNHYTKKAANGIIYSIIKEKDGYYVKSGLNESSLDYINGMANKSRNRHRSYSSALKRINLILKPINEQYNNGYGDSLYEQNDEKEKFVLKTPESEDEMGMGDEMPMDVDVDDEMDMGDEMDMDTEDDMDMEDDMGGEGDMGDEGGTSIKSVQKLTGKLGQKMRELEDDIDSDTIKYVLNSIISAVDLEQLDDEDREDIVDRLDPSEDEDYGMEDDFEVGVDGDMGDEDMEMDDDMGDEDMEMGDEDMEMGDEDMEDEPTNTLEESLKRRVNNTLTSYYKDSTSEKQINEGRVKNYLRKNINKSKTKKSLSNLCETIEQEITLKKVLNSDRGYKYSKKTKKGGVIVLENNRQTIGITRYGKIIK